MKKKKQTQDRFKFDEIVNRKTKYVGLSTCFILLCFEFTTSTYFRKLNKPYNLETITRITNLNKAVVSFSQR